MGLAVIFPGQGSQTAAMFAPFAGTAAGGVLDQVLHLTGLVLDQQGHLPAEAIFANRHAQPLAVAHGVGLWTVLAPLLPRPAAILGYSVGEISAAHAAGALSAEAAPALAVDRAGLMDGACAEPQAMLALRGRLDGLMDRVAEAGAYPAILNGPEHLVVAGTRVAVDRLTAGLGQTALTVRPLQVSVASHCPLMAPAVAGLRGLLDKILTRPRVPFIGAWNARRALTREALVTALAEQIAAPVRWASTLDAAIEHGARAFLEIGPGDQMTRIVRDLHPRMPARSLAEFRSPAGAAAWVEKVL
ncbi:MAG: ACP S-malonyltransferase [Qingshengfaniella sp.]